jgi:hypothetical protein
MIQDMNLSDQQKSTVKGWIESGQKLSEIQGRLASELGVTMTYMEVRFLVDDLKVMPKDIDLPKPVEPIKTAAPAKPAGAGPEALDVVPEGEPEPENEVPAGPPLGLGKVKISMDALTVPGTMASGKVTFSDGQVAQWYLDQMGRLGLSPQQKGYRPSAADVQAFQVELQREFEKLGP